MLSREDNELLCRVGPGTPVDVMVIRTRRRVIRAARALSDGGVVPPGVDEPQVYRCRSGGVVLPRDASWLDATKDLRRAFARP
jgi:phthalate 4,5-dioxygenase oxygenase subunit